MDNTQNWQLLTESSLYLKLLLQISEGPRVSLVGEGGMLGSQVINTPATCIKGVVKTLQLCYMLDRYMHLFHPEWEMEHSGFDRNVHKEPPYASTNVCNVLAHPQRSINITFKPTAQVKIVLSKDVQAGGNIL